MRKVCANCNKFLVQGYLVVRNEKVEPISFCSRKCYLNFWSKTPNFKALQDGKNFLQNKVAH